MTDQNPSASRRTIVSVRGSVVDVRCESHLPTINSHPRVAKEGRIVIEVWAQLDAQRVRGSALTAMQGFARGMAVENTGSPPKAPVGRFIRSHMFDVFGHKETRRPKDEFAQLYVFHNRFESATLHEPVSQR